MPTLEEAKKAVQDMKKQDELMLETVRDLRAEGADTLADALEELINPIVNCTNQLGRSLDRIDEADPIANVKIAAEMLHIIMKRSRHAGDAKLFIQIITALGGGNNDDV